LCPAIAVLSGLSFFLHLKSSNSLLTEQLEDELAHTTNDFDELLRRRQVELNDIASSADMRKYVTDSQAQTAIVQEPNNDQVKDSLSQFLARQAILYGCRSPLASETFDMCCRVSTA